MTPKLKRKRKLVNFTLPPDTIEAITEAAEKTQLSRSRIVQFLVEWYLSDFIEQFNALKQGRRPLPPPGHGEEP